jgi:nitroreductase
MKRAVKNIFKSIIGERFISFYRAYSSVPVMLFFDLQRILSFIHCRRRFANAPEVLLSSLRTSAHIVDKGLQVDNWEVGHSRARYFQLCKEIEGLKNSLLNDDPSYQWAVEKRNEYEHAQKIGQINLHSIKDSQITFGKSDLLKLIRSRRSIRTFQNRPIDTESLKELAGIVNWAPTSCNRQPTKLFITQNPEKVATCLAQCAGATCHGKEVPCFIAVCADTRFYMVKDRNLPFIDVSLGLQNMLLMAHVQGLGGTILNWQHHSIKEETALRKALGIPEYYSIIVNLIMGYYEKSVPIPGRKGDDLTYSIVS